MSSKVTVLNAWPPIMKVTGEQIKILLDVSSTDTVKKKLTTWDIPTKNGYVFTQDILNYLSEPELVLDVYEGRSEGAKSI